jgi:MarR family transcriptional regulator, organic hydroperoxide resistance regulator
MSTGAGKAGPMDDFIQGQGLPFFAHLLRRLSDEFGRGSAQWFAENGIAAPPQTVSTLLALDEKGPLSLTELAEILRQSHPLVITWVRLLKAPGFIASTSDPDDGRRTLLSLTPAGRDEVARLRPMLTVVARAYSRLIKESEAELFDGLWRVEEACRREPFADRLRREMADDRQ